ncbi:hypothetical protein D3C74_462830 [compost metagenome]
MLRAGQQISGRIRYKQREQRDQERIPERVQHHSHIHGRKEIHIIVQRQMPVQIEQGVVNDQQHRRDDKQGDP